LAVAEVITGDAKYGEVATTLREKYFYDINAVQPRPYFRPRNVVPGTMDCHVEFLFLMNFDLDSERQILYRRGLEESYLFISRQTNPFWSFFYGTAGF
jgi:hypothetical protein